MIPIATSRFNNETWDENCSYRAKSNASNGCVPPMTGLDYIHSCGEIFENEYGALKTCSMTNCEDETCADQYSLKQTNGDDHKVYLQHSLECDANASQ